MPAAGRRVFTRLYDPIVAQTMRERRWRPQLRDQVSAALPAGGTVVDVGAGTGTFAISLAADRPDAHVVGVDGDARALRLAEAKPGAERVEWREGLAGHLPREDAGVDAVVMSLLLHHLDPAAKEHAVGDAVRVLRPGGRVHVADWGRPHDPVMRAAFFVLQLIDGFAGTRDHVAGRVPALLIRAGGGDVAERGRLRTVWGSLELLEATRPATDFALPASDHATA